MSEPFGPVGDVPIIGQPTVLDAVLTFTVKCNKCQATILCVGKPGTICGVCIGCKQGFGYERAILTPMGLQLAVGVKKLD